jgi:predicted nuclease of predicted toxin-antitoxin system
VRVLLDENLPVGLVHHLVGHDATTVAALGWAGITNGELLSRASSRFDAFLTMDRNLGQQQALRSLSFGVVLLSARSNRLVDLQPLVPQLLRALGALRPGSLERVGA